jgi:hypothetical protein
LPAGRPPVILPPETSAGGRIGDRAASRYRVPGERAIQHGREELSPGRRWAALILAGVLLALFALNAALSVRHKTPTIDEFAHVPAGYLGLTSGRFDLYGKTPPLARTLFSLPILARQPVLPDPPPGNRMAGWYPWSYATGFFNANVREHGIAFVDRVYGDARLVVLGLTVLLGVAVFLWSRALHGEAGGLLALALLTLDPTILAHSRLATVDMAETLFFFLAVAAFTAWLLRRTPLRLVLAGLAAGAALSAKFTAVLLGPIWLGLCVIELFRNRADGTPWRRRLRDLLVGVAVATLVMLLVVNLVYGFAGSFRLWGSYEPRSERLSALRTPWLSWVPVPLPQDFVRGFDAQQVDVEVGDFPNYFNGRWSRSGWWYYYPTAYLLKTPLPLVLLVLTALAMMVAGRRDTRWRHHAFTGLPPDAPLRRLSAWAVGLSLAVLLFAACFLNRLDIGVRYILPVYPFLFVGVASLGRLLRRGEPVAGGLIAAATLATAISTLAVFPHYLAYFNLLAGGPDGGWRVLTNSNNDWGQDLKFLARELEARGVDSVRLAYFGHAEPAAYGIDYTVPLPDASGADALGEARGRYPYTFRPGVYAISANLLVGFPYYVMDHGRWVPAGNVLTEPQEIFAWFRKREPETVIGGSILLYRVEAPSL